MEWDCHRFLLPSETGVRGDSLRLRSRYAIGTSQSSPAITSPVDDLLLHWDRKDGDVLWSLPSTTGGAVQAGIHGPMGPVEITA